MDILQMMMEYCPKFIRFNWTIFVFLVFPRTSTAELYYKTPTDPICPPGYVETGVQTKEIPHALLPTGPQDQGTTPTCGPHAALDALGIFLKGQESECAKTSPSPSGTMEAKGTGGKFGCGINVWKALEDYKCPSDVGIGPIPFLLRVHKRPEALSPHSGKTVAEACRGTDASPGGAIVPLLASVEAIATATAPSPSFNIHTWDLFRGENDLEKA